VEVAIPALPRRTAPVANRQPGRRRKG